MTSWHLTSRSHFRAQVQQRVCDADVSFGRRRRCTLRRRWLGNGRLWVGVTVGGRGSVLVFVFFHRGSVVSMFFQLNQNVSAIPNEKINNGSNLLLNLTSQASTCQGVINEKINVKKMYRVFLISDRNEH